MSAAEKKLATERADITKRATELTTREKSVADASAQAKAGLAALRERAAAGDHDGVLAELGLDYSTITKAKIERGKAKAAAPVAPGAPGAPAAAAAPMTAEQIQKMIDDGVAATLTKREEAAKKAREEADAAQWKEVVTNFDGFVSQGGEAKFEMLTHELSARPQIIHDALRELAVRSPQLTIEEAAAKLEEFFIGEAVKAANRPKVKALLGASKQIETDLPRAQPGPATADVPRTLTNALAAEQASSETPAPSVAPQSRSAKIRQEREARAAEERRIDALAASRR